MDRSIKVFAAVIFLGAIGVGCTVEGGVSIPPPPAPVRTGTITQRWSIGGSFDRNLCATYGAARMELVITDTSGRQVARAYQPCNEMQMTVRLPPGSYVADAVLLDMSNREVSTTLPLRPFRIIGGLDTFVDTDFPTSSMLNVLSVTEEPSSSDIDVDDESD